jgi:hypothetical protein
VAPHPARAPFTQQDGLQPADGERRGLGREPRVKRACERLADAVFDEGDGVDVAQPERAERPARLGAHELVARPADGEIALLELAGEREELE